MLFIKSNEEKKLVFEVDIHGCDSDNLQGFVRFEMYGAEYGFPVEVDDRKITAVIPPLKNVVEKDIEDGTVINARLDMITERHYFMPWEGEVKIGAPMDIKAKIKEEKTSGPSVSSRLMTSASVKEEKAIAPSKTKTEGLQEDDRILRLEKIVASLAKTMKGGGVRRHVQEAIQPEPEPVPVKKPRKEVIAERKYLMKEKLKNVTEKDIINYMERAGTKNETVQQIVLNEATAAASEAGIKGNIGILKYVIKALKKNK